MCMPKIKYLKEWVIEVLLLISYPVKTLMYFFVPIHKVKKSKDRDIPIVFVEQWFSQNIYHYFMKRYLEEKGFRVYMFNKSLFIGGIDDGAIALEKFIVQHKIEKAILLGISIGGVTALRYAQIFGFTKIEKIITLGSPFQGTPWIIPLFFLKAGRDLLPGSSFVKKINREKIEEPDKILCINAKYDELVPDESSKLPGVREITLDIVGHNYLHILANETYKAILEEISK